MSLDWDQPAEQHQRCSAMEPSVAVLSVSAKTISPAQVCSGHPFFNMDGILRIIVGGSVVSSAY